MEVFDSNFDERESHLRVLADQLFLRSRRTATDLL